MDYIESLKANCLILSNPINLTASFTTLNSTYGSMDQLRSLIGACHRKKIRIVIDFIPNHTFDDHEWFLASSSSSSSDSQANDYYVWRDRPNDWVIFFLQFKKLNSSIQIKKAKSKFLFKKKAKHLRTKRMDQT